MAHTSNLVSHYVSEAVGNIKSHIKEKPTSDEVKNLNGLPTSSVAKFENIISDYSRRAFYSSHCDLVEPQEVELGTLKIIIKGKVTEVKRCGYIVPFRKSIQALLLLPEVATAVRNPHYSSSTMMKDVCDGSYVQSHPLSNSQMHCKLF